MDTEMVVMAMVVRMLLYVCLFLNARERVVSVGGMFVGLCKMKGEMWEYNSEAEERVVI